MIIDLLGVLENGAPRAPGVPANPRKTLRFQHGSDVTIRFSLVTSDGVGVDVSTGVLTLNVRKIASNVPSLIAKTGTPSPSDGIRYALFTFVPADTKDLLVGVYIYDVWFQQTGSGTRDAVVPLSPFYFEPSATSVPG